MPRKTFLVLLLLAAFGVRLGAVLALRNPTEGPKPAHGADALEYDWLGSQVAQGHGYVKYSGEPTSFRAPGYPLFLAALYRTVGHHYLPVYLAQCLLGAVACVLAYLLARELLEEGAARLAGLLAVVYFPHVYFATYFDSENVFVPCLAAGVWLFLVHLRTRAAWAAGLAGLALGYAALTRPYALLLVPLLLTLLAWLRLRERRRVVVPALALTAAFLAVLLPWTYRNHVVHGRPVLVATNGGSTFYGGNNDLVLAEPRLWGGWVETNVLPGRDVIEAAPDEVSHDQVEWRLGMQWVREHPASLPRLALYKLARLTLPDLDSLNKKYVLAQVLGYSPFLLLFLAAGVRMLRRRDYWTPGWLAVHGTVAATVATALIFWGSPRFRDANTPLLMVYAAVGVQALNLLRRRPASSRTDEQTARTAFEQPLTPSTPLR